MEKTVDGYIAGFPEPVQAVLNDVRHTIAEAVPEASEGINYGMPAFKMNRKVLVYFAAYKKHIGFYPTPSGIEAFAEALAGYKTSKGAVQFPLDKDIPLDLIREIVRFRIGEVSGN